MVTEGSFAKNKCRHDDKQQKNNEIGYKALDITDGKAVSRHIEKVYFFVASGPDRQQDDCENPGHPDEPFYEIAPCHFLVHRKKNGLLTTRTWTKPAAIPSSKEQRADKHKYKKNKAAIDNAV